MPSCILYKKNVFNSKSYSFKLLYMKSLFNECVWQQTNRVIHTIKGILTLPKYLSRSSTYLCITSRVSNSLSSASIAQQKYRLAYLQSKLNHMDDSEAYTILVIHVYWWMSLLKYWCNRNERFHSLKGIWPSAQIFHRWNKNCFSFIISSRIQFKWKIIRGMKRGFFLKKST